MNCCCDMNQVCGSWETPRALNLWWFMNKWDFDSDRNLFIVLESRGLSCLQRFPRRRANANEETVPQSKHRSQNTRGLTGAAQMRTNRDRSHQTMPRALKRGHGWTLAWAKRDRSVRRLLERDVLDRAAGPAASKHVLAFTLSLERDI